MQQLDAMYSPAVDPRQDRGLWWQREHLTYADGDRLLFAGHDVEALAEKHGTPVQLYDGNRLRENIDRLADAFAVTGHPARIYYAIKANRFAPLVRAMRLHGRTGIDCCSPGEVGLAMEHGFSGPEISFTGTALSDRDIEAIGPLNIRVNLDSISAIHKMGRRFPGRRIGLRVNPQMGAGATPQLTYAGARPTKFGIYGDRFDEALRLAASYGLIVEGVHMHVGSGWLAEGMDRFLGAVDRLCTFASKVPDLRYVNVGGGIGVVHGPQQTPVDVLAYARGLSERVTERLGSDVEICCEPGDYLVNDTCITLAEVTMVEEKGGELFVGLDLGFNSNPQAAHYAFPHEVLSASRGPAGPNARRCSVVGNINEAIDVFSSVARIGDVHEGDIVAVLNTGGYSSSMASNHCLRERATEVLV
jgi:diaminopimelate decarboxylase